MTSRERVQAVFDRRLPDRLPRELKLTDPLRASFEARFGGAEPADYFALDVREVRFAAPTECADFSRYYPGGVPRLANSEGWEIGEWGVGSAPGSLLHFVHLEHPMRDLADASDLKLYPFPDLTRSKRHRHLEGQVKELHERGFFVVGFLEWTVFELAWYLRGMEKLFEDFAFNERFAAALLDIITETRSFQARRFAEAGVDLIKIGDDVGTQRSMLISPALYRTWLKPRHARIIAAARAAKPGIPVCYHSDGDCRAIIPDLIEAGITALNPVQPECLDLARLKKEFGRELVFWGGIGTQTAMPFFAPEEVYRTVQSTIEALGPAAYFPCPTHALEPEVPWENIMAYLQAVEDWPERRSQARRHG